MSSLLVDLGGTDLKFGISDESELQFKHFRRIPMPKLIASSSYRREIDAFSLVSLLLKWINRYLSEFKDIERILISGQMGCWVAGDAESLPKSVISWQDLRSIERFGTRENAVHKFDLNELLARNGREIEPGVPLLGLLTFFDEVKSTHKLRFRSLITLVSEALIGKPSEFIHITDAASSGLINMRTGNGMIMFVAIFFIKLSYLRSLKISFLLVI